MREPGGVTAQSLAKLRVATWNTEWRATASSDACVIRERLNAFQPHIVCLTETHLDFLDEWAGHVICGGTDWGGPVYETRREVLLWSRWPWISLDTIGAPDLPQGHFASAVLDSPLGNITVAGIVIPYHMANVRTGARDRRPWELHERYLDALPQITHRLPARSLVLGDYNQRNPSKWVPRAMRAKLQDAFAGLKIVSTGSLELIGKPAIDHIAVGSAWGAAQVASISNLTSEDKQISDHFGVSAIID